MSRPYFRHLTKSHLNIPTDIGTMEPEVRCQVLDSFLQDSILVSRYGYYPWFNVNLRNISSYIIHQINQIL